MPETRGNEISCDAGPDSNGKLGNTPRKALLPSH